MKEINKEIARLVFEIIIASFIIIFTHFIWDDIKINNYRSFAANSYMNTLALTEYNANDFKLLAMTDEEAKTIAPSTLSVENLVNQAKDYSLLLVISKNSSLDFTKVTVMIDDIPYKLKDQNRIEDNEAIYITLNSEHIDEKNTHEVRIYLNENENVLEESNLNYYFEIKENNNLFAAK